MKNQLAMDPRRISNAKRQWMQMFKEDRMNKTRLLGGKLGIVLCSALLGWPIFGQPGVSVGVSVTLPSVEIRTESDFYEPLAPQGEWVVVGNYGRCWRPGHVARDWRPYCNGRWERTEAGWYWVSDEPWAWATYHYGRWDFTDQYGWYWVPQTQWAPAWVSWHEGGGYVGWAPLLPAVRLSAGGFVGFNAAIIPPRAFVFVEHGKFLEPIRPTMVVVNNTTIINKTVSMSNTRIVNKTVINEGPAIGVIEKASGRKVQSVAVREIRHTEESPIIARQKTPNAGIEKKVQSSAVGEAVRAPTVAHEPAANAPRIHEAPVEKQRPIPTPPEGKPEANHAPAIREPVQPKANGVAKAVRPIERNVPKPAQEKPPTNEKERGGSDQGEKGHEGNPKQ
ncbi:MAG: hypothetical protein JWR26_2472 [Pedosphaera sp.]|nr:hypothetical protein [Pedosphaera sp.]